MEKQMSLAFRRALDPRFAKLQRLASDQSESPNKDSALKSAINFLNAYPQNAQANYLMARAFIRDQRPGDAIEYAERAVGLDSNSSEYIFLLGRLYLELQLYEFAAPLLRDAIEKKPDDLRMQWAMADFLQERGDGIRACQHYELALQLTTDPTQIRALKSDLADCLASSAMKSEARQLYFELENDSEISVWKNSNRMAQKNKRSEVYFQKGLLHKKIDLACYSLWETFMKTLETLIKHFTFGASRAL
jgi:uncharacterized protein (TIGR02996 family)